MHVFLNYKIQTPMYSTKTQLVCDRNNQFKKYTNNSNQLIRYFKPLLAFLVMFQSKIPFSGYLIKEQDSLKNDFL